MTRLKSQRISDQRGFTLIQLLVIVAVIAIIASLLVPGLAQSQRASHERGAQASLRMIASAEADFRANDRDGNGVNDFWTSDVKGLYTMTSAAVRGARGDRSDPPIRLIELPLAASDLDRTQVTAGGENMDLSAFATHAPKEGFWTAALIADLSGNPGDPELYRTDTQGSLPMGKCHHPTKFGFVTVPHSSWTGRFSWIINEGNSALRRAIVGEVWKSGTLSPALNGIPADFQNWPSDSILKSYWGRA